MKPYCRILSLALLVPIWLAQPALAAKVKTVLAKDVNMAHYKTYQWLPPVS